MIACAERRVAGSGLFGFDDGEEIVGGDLVFGSLGVGWSDPDDFAYPTT